MNCKKRLDSHCYEIFLEEEKIRGLKQMFKGMDSDNSGTITLEELKHGLSNQGTRLTKSEVKQLMEAMQMEMELYIMKSSFVHNIHIL